MCGCHVRVRVRVRVRVCVCVCVRVLPEWGLQYAQEACELRDHKTLDAAVLRAYPD